MHSFLFISKNTDSLQKKAMQLCEKNHIDALDQTTLITEKTIGIEDIRNLQKTIFLTPIKSPIKAVIIYHAQTMTLDAQNAFLKTLEEPPQNTIIILLAKSSEHFLPTVLSRCAIIDDKSANTPINPQDKKIYKEFIRSIKTGSLSEKLYYAQQIGKTKEGAIAYLQGAIITAREDMIENLDKSAYISIKAMQKTHTLLYHTNANPRLAIEHMLLDTVCSS